MPSSLTLVANVAGSFDVLFCDNARPCDDNLPCDDTSGMVALAAGTQTLTQKSPGSLTLTPVP